MQRSDVNDIDIDPALVNTDKFTAIIVRELTVLFPDSRLSPSVRHAVFLNGVKYQVKLARPLNIRPPLVVDPNNTQALSVLQHSMFAAFLKIVEANAVSNKNNPGLREEILHAGRPYDLFQIEADKSVSYSSVISHKTLVAYPPRKGPSKRRFAILEEKIGGGDYGEVFKSTCSLSINSAKNKVDLKVMKPGKQRVAKVQSDSQMIGHTDLIADEEYEMTSKLAPELRAKPLARNADEKISVMLMRYVRGNDLRNLFFENGVDTDSLRMEVCLLAAEALMKIHARGGVHRDVKLNNMVLQDEPDGRQLYILDYGIAKFASQDNTENCGNPIGKAPETWRAGKSSFASDVYALCRNFEVILGYMPSWEMSELAENFHKPFDKLYANHIDKKERDLLNKCGLRKMLDGMREIDPDKRLPLANVITQLKCLIWILNHVQQVWMLKAPQQARSIFLPATASAAAAAASPEVDAKSSSRPQHRS